jgi:ABC-type multidrug transport system ATPase subunit
MAIKTTKQKITRLRTAMGKFSSTLQFHNLSLSYDSQVVLNGASGELNTGDFICLIGDNGSGKTSLLNMLAGYLEPSTGTITLTSGGEKKCFNFPKSWLRHLSFLNTFTPEKFAQMGVVKTWQGGRSFSTLSLRDNITVASQKQNGENPFFAVLRPDIVHAQERRHRHAAEISLAASGLAGRENSSANKISLGQGMRVAILRAVQAGAKVLLLDEPLAGLDAKGREIVINLLAELSKEHSTTIMIVEHILNLPEVLKLATAVWKLEHGQLQIGDISNIQNLIPTGGTTNSWLEEMASDQGIINDIELDEGVILSIISTKSTDLMRPILEVQGLNLSHGNRQVLSHISFKLYAGQIAILQAPNGYGKTSLLDAIAGLIPSSGEILLDGRPIHNMNIWDRSKQGLSLLRARDNIFKNLKVKEMLALSSIDDPPEEIKPFLGKHLSSLSGGERQRVILACSNKKRGILQLMDEPFSALDLIGVGTVQEMIKSNNDTVYLIALPANI